MIIRRALILHAWYEKPDTQWYSWLKQELEKKGYEVLVPDLPTLQTKMPDQQKILTFFNKNKTLVPDSHTTVVGHSIGCLIALRLAEQFKYEKMFLIAGWDYDDLYPPHRLFWKRPINHKKIKQNVKDIYCFSSDNDPYTTAFEVEEMSKRLAGKFVLIKEAGHFTAKFGVRKIPQLLQYL